MRIVNGSWLTSLRLPPSPKLLPPTASPLRGTLATASRCSAGRADDPRTDRLSARARIRLRLATLVLTRLFPAPVRSGARHRALLGLFLSHPAVWCSWAAVRGALVAACGSDCGVALERWRVPVLPGSCQIRARSATRHGTGGRLLRVIAWRCVCLRVDHGAIASRGLGRVGNLEPAGTLSVSCGRRRVARCLYRSAGLVAPRLSTAAARVHRSQLEATGKREPHSSDCLGSFLQF